MRDENRQIILSVRVSIPDRKVRNGEPNQCISLPYKVSIPDRKVRNETDDAANGDVQQFQSLIGRFVMGGGSRCSKWRTRFQSLIGRFVIIDVVLGGWLFWFQSLIGRFVMQGVKTLMRKYYLFQSLIGRFVILNTPHVHYVGHFNIVAEIMQSFVSQTHKTS